jgi:hypothetical protein
MALNPGPIGTSIADYLIENKPAPGTSQTNEDIEAIWQGVMGLIYADIKANLDILPTKRPAAEGNDLTVPIDIPIIVNTGSGAGGVGETTSAETVTGMGSCQ